MKMKIVLAVSFLVVGIACIVLPFVLSGCDSRSDHPLPPNTFLIGQLPYGKIYRMEDVEKGNLIYVVEQPGGGWGGITVVPMVKK
jgi:hypothetical protein